MTKAIIDDARRVAKALGWHPTAQPCQCWNCQANRALITAADEIERLRAIENAALHVASSFLKRNNTVDPLTMHKLDFALEASAVEPKADPVDYVQFGWVPFHDKQGCDSDSYVEHEEDCTAIIEGWRWVPAYAAVSPAVKSGEQS